MLSLASKKIALVGTTCTLKTSTVNILRERNHNPAIAFIPESARLIAEEQPELFSDSRRLDERQSRIATKQLQLEELYASSQTTKLIVLDRCILDTYLYCLLMRVDIPKEIRLIYEYLMPSYDLFCLFDPIGITYVPDDVRMCSADFDLRSQWHEEFKNALKSHNNKHIVVTGGLEQRVSAVQRAMAELLCKAHCNSPTAA